MKKISTREISASHLLLIFQAVLLSLMWLEMIKKYGTPRILRMCLMPKLSFPKLSLQIIRKL